jgi:hypothetical protein
MAQFRARRQNRYTTLINSGFSKVETQQLSKISFEIPYMKDIIRQRKTELKDCKTKVQTEQRIRELYFGNNWTKTGQYGLFKGIRLADPWKMLRHYADLYKKKNPDYVSPYLRKKTKDFIAPDITKQKLK